MACINLLLFVIVFIVFNRFVSLSCLLLSLVVIYRFYRVLLFWSGSIVFFSVS